MKSKASVFVCLLALLGIALFSLPLDAKDAGRLSGKVKNANGDGLLGAIITIFKPDGSGGSLFFARTDRNGFYNLANIAPGAYYLQVSHDGYQPLASASVKIDSGKTTSMDVILQEFLGLISDDSDPRNWDTKSLMRGASSRRLIFRGLPGIQGLESESPFYRSGAMNVASNANLSSENQSVAPGSGKNGVISNFAFIEPVSQHARMIFAGQLNSGYGSFWRVRNTYNYRPDESRDWRFSLGYGRRNLGQPSMSDIGRPADFFAGDPTLRESAIQTLLLGFGGTSKFLDIMQIGYGFDYSRLYYGSANNFISPYLQVSVSPARSWTIKSSWLSRRVSDENTLLLPDNEPLNLAEPTYLNRIGSNITMSQSRHTELAIIKSVSEDTNVEVAGYQDHTDGPGSPFLVTARSGGQSETQFAQLREDQSRQRGLRLAVDQKIFDFLHGSIAYVYGSGTGVDVGSKSLTTDQLAQNLLQYMHRSYYNSLTGQLGAQIPRTHTNLIAVVRWYPGSPVTSLDFFADHMDILTKGVNFSIRQGIPLPEFLGVSGRWEALIDVRNVFEQGSNRIRTSDGDLFLTRNPRVVRFGLNLNFY
jgi:hypothetical protein